LSGLGEKFFRLERGPSKFEEWDFGLGNHFRSLGIGFPKAENHSRRLGIAISDCETYPQDCGMLAQNAKPFRRNEKSNRKMRRMLFF
jgi:hypothetical protein